MVECDHLILLYNFRQGVNPAKEPHSSLRTERVESHEVALSTRHGPSFLCKVVLKFASCDPTFSPVSVAGKLNITPTDFFWPANATPFHTT